MISSMENKRTLVLLFLTCLVFASTAISQNTRYDLALSFVPKSICPRCSTLSVFAETPIFATVMVRPEPLPEDLPYFVIPDRKPDWLSFKFSSRPKHDSYDNKVINEEVVVSYYVQESRELNDELWKSGEQMTARGSDFKYRFVLEFSPLLVGHTVCVQPLIDAPPYGPIVHDELFDTHVGCFVVIQPITHKDSAYVLGARVKYLTELRQFTDAISLFDSLNEAGWTEGVFDALRAARRLGKHHDALRLMDIAYETYGTVFEHVGRGVKMSEAQYLEIRNATVRELEEQDR